MKNRDIARKIVTGYINSTALDFDEKLIELAAINGSDDVLLEHIDVMIALLVEARKEILDSKEGDKNENNK